MRSGTLANICQPAGQRVSVENANMTRYRRFSVCCCVLCVQVLILEGYGQRAVKLLLGLFRVIPHVFARGQSCDNYLSNRMSFVQPGGRELGNYFGGFTAYLLRRSVILPLNNTFAVLAPPTASTTT